MLNERYKSCIDACNACALACDHFTSEDLNGKDIKIMTTCINLDRECASFCRATAHIMSIGGRFTKDICTLCAAVCDACAHECEKHPEMHACAKECRNCARECRKTATFF